MATLSLLDFDAGSEGSAVTVSAPWSKTGSTTVTYAGAAAAHGTFGARFSNTGTSGRFQYDYGSAQTGALVLSFYITPRAFSSAVQYLALATTLTSGGTNRGDVRINTGGTTRTVSIRNVSTAVATSTTALAVGTTYRLEWRLDHAASTQTLRIYVGDSTTVTETLTGAWSAADSRVLAFGPYSAAASGQIDYDTVQVADDWTGPYSPGGGLPAPDATKIGHLGDSLTAQSPGPGPTDMDARYLAAGYADADVNGISGRFVYNAGDTSGGTPAVIDAWAAAGFNPYDIVVALGTNDTLSSLSSNWLTGLNNLRAKITSTLPGTHRIWWVNIAAAPDNPGGMDGGIGTKGNTVADYNAFLVAQLNGTTEKILDWNAYAKANLTDLAYWNTSDGIHVHMTNAGYAARNAWIAGRFMTRVTGTLSTSWAVAQRQAATTSTAWTVTQRATSATSTSWAVSQRLVATTPNDWAVRARVSSTASSGWSVAQRVTKATSTAWDVTQRVTATIPQTWAVRTRATSTTSQQWGVAGRGVTTLSTSWDTQSTAPTTRVTTMLATCWAVAARVSSPLLTRWDVAQRSSGPALSLVWDIRARATAATPARWDVATRLGAVTPSTWETRSRAATTLALSWAVESDAIVGTAVPRGRLTLTMPTTGLDLTIPSTRLEITT